MTGECFDIIVIGGGAAGLMAAGTAAEGGARCLLIEKMEKCARKVRITGKGRCNITNRREMSEFIAKVNSGKNLAEVSLRAFDNEKTIKFFEANGLRLITERGDRVFPESGKAWDVADTLVNWARRSGAEIRCFTKALKIVTEKGKVSAVVIEDKNRKQSTITAPKVVIATGGLSYPSTGSTGDGLMFAHALGHNIVEVRPSLVPLDIEDYYSRALEGVALRNVNVSLVIDGKISVGEFGEMEFKDGSATGAIILRISREAVDAIIDEQKVEISIDLKPALSIEKLIGRIERETEAMPASATVKDLLRKLLLQKLIAPFAKKSAISVDAPLSKIDKRQVAAALKDFRLTITDYCPFEQAIITAGGIDTTEIDAETLESKLIKGLFFAGEVIDIDAQTGGYNLQIAFSTGRKAGMSKS